MDITTGSRACQTVGQAPHTKATPTDRLPNVMIECTPVSASSQRVLTNTKMLHAVIRFLGLENLPDACDRVFEAGRSLTMRAQHGEVCTCMHTDTHTQINLCCSGSLSIRDSNARTRAAHRPRAFW